MTEASAIEELILTRVAAAGVAPGSLATEQVRDLAEYLRLLTHWNRSTNLTALCLEPLSAEAVDRLIVEPVVAAHLLASKPDGLALPGGSRRLLVDLGSGGGSPAIPLALAIPDTRLVMVESRSKKCAFLREAARCLSIPSEVRHERFEALRGQQSFSGTVGLVSIRAVRLDRALVSLVDWMLAPSGRVISFGSHRIPAEDGLPEHWAVTSDATPFESGKSVIRLLTVPRGTSA